MKSPSTKWTQVSISEISAPEKRVIRFSRILVGNGRRLEFELSVLVKRWSYGFLKGLNTN